MNFFSSFVVDSMLESVTVLSPISIVPVSDFVENVFSVVVSWLVWVVDSGVKHCILNSIISH